MSFGSAFLHGLEKVGGVALKVGEIGAPIAAQIFIPQFKGAVDQLVAQAEERFPSPGVQTTPAGPVPIKTGPQKFDWVMTILKAADPFIQIMAQQHGMTFTAADLDAAVEASVVAFKADLAAKDAIEKLFAAPAVQKAA